MPVPHRAARSQRGITVGLLSIFTLCFCSILFMLGRPVYWKLYAVYLSPPTPIVAIVDPAPAPITKGPTALKPVTRPEVDTHGEGETKKPAANPAGGSSPPPSPVPPSPQPPSPSPLPPPPLESPPPPTVLPSPPPAAATKSPETASTTKTPVTTPATASSTPSPTATATAPTATQGNGTKDLSKLTKERVLEVAQDGYVMVTWANYHYIDFTLSWVKHVKDVGVTGYFIGAMDEQILQELLKRNLNTFSMSSGLTLGDFGWGSKTFAKMGRQKIRLIAMFLKLGVYVIIADVDTVWLRNPIPYFKQYPNADILTSSDHLSYTVKDESLEKWPDASSAGNIGIMMFREKSLPFVEEWIEIIEADDNVWDQNAFNDLFRRGVQSLPDDKDNLFLGDNGKLKLGILPVSIFASGHTFFVQRMAETLKLKPYVVHATFQFSGTPGKRNRMREMLIWDDPPSYFDTDNGFLRFDLDIPEAMLKGSGPLTNAMDLANVQGHFKLVNHQIQQIRNALAVATVLNRTVIMPQLWCGLDRWWAPHAGRIPGTTFDLPFKCPMDHVFDLEGGWARKLAESEFGPNVDFRESSFLDNPRLPAAVNASRIEVEMCPPGSKECSDGTIPALITNGRVKIQSGLKSDALKKALSIVSGFKILSFTSMGSGSFGGFSSDESTNRFQNRMRTYTSIWCCIHAHPGHIHYDMLWDVPHTDKFGRSWDKWEPKTGP